MGEELPPVVTPAVIITPAPPPGADLNIPPPGANGWKPPGWFPLAAALFLGVGGAVAGVLVAPVITPLAIIAAVLGGSMSGLAGYLGIKSVGPRTP